MEVSKASGDASEKKSVHPLVGRRVLNVHRQSCDMPQSYRDAHKGVITDVIEGCNALVVVLFDGRDAPVAMVPNDMAFCELWPKEGCRVVVNPEPGEPKVVDEYVQQQIETLREVAADDARLTRENNIDLNPFSTQGGRNLWQGGWDDKRPANLVDGSVDWRYWERGRQARIYAEETECVVELERPRG